nr:unnamed protein product [Callosobruchus chinensis]
MYYPTAEATCIVERNPGLLVGLKRHHHVFGNTCVNRLLGKNILLLTVTHMTGTALLNLKTFFNLQFRTERRVLNKIWFALPSLELVKAFTPEAKSAAEKSYKNMKLRLLDWDICRALIVSPIQVAAKLRGSSAQADLFNKAIPEALSIDVETHDSRRRKRHFSESSSSKEPLARSKKPKRKKRRLSSSSSDVNPTEARLSRMEGMIENLFHLVSGNKENEDTSTNRQEYINYKGATVEKKIPRRDCLSCRFKCLEYFSEEEVALIHREFWNNTDSEKGFFYDKTTERCLVQRKRNRSEERKRTKIYSFKYYFVKNDEKIRVCKAFYLGVLSISQIRISYFYSHKRSGITTTPTQDKRGSKTSTRIKEEKRKVIRDHINMFPRVPSHYCRNSSSREYLERSLSLSKMYDLYIEYCSENNLIPEKKWLYYHIFNNEFNIGFHKPKKDLCDICTEYDLKKQEGTLADDLQEKYRTHIEGKLTAREEKLKDVNACKEDETMALMCFDMQSVLTCPQMQISKAYYKKKFAVYNLTGYDVVKKRGYCALWHELLGGRKGIDIASALYVILEKLLAERPNVTAIILWSDSCVPQNKNSHMSAAILHFLKEHPSVKFITQKFQVPGHSCVQEVDAMHSVLDRYLNKLELHSPLAIFKAIINARTKKPYKAPTIGDELNDDLGAFCIANDWDTFSPVTREIEAAIPRTDTVIEQQGLKCQRLGENSWKKIRYAGAQKKLQASPIFSTLKINSSLYNAYQPQSTSMKDILSKNDLAFGTIIHGLLKQRSNIQEALKDAADKAAGGGRKLEGY